MYTKSVLRGSFNFYKILGIALCRSRKNTFTPAKNETEGQQYVHVLIIAVMNIKLRKLGVIIMSRISHIGCTLEPR